MKRKKDNNVNDKKYYIVLKQKYKILGNNDGVNAMDEILEQLNKKDKQRQLKG